MSVSCSDDLLCGEDSGILSEWSSSDLESPKVADEWIAGFIEDERNYVPALTMLNGFTLSRWTHRLASNPLRGFSRYRYLMDFNHLLITLLPAGRTVQLELQSDSGCGWHAHWLILAFDEPVQAYYGFQPLTAYLSVNYLDRFLYSRRLPQTNGWPMQLLSVACLSVAAKMEEPLVPSLLDLQVEGAQFIFEPRTIRRMELLVLGVLDWRLRSITPFSFISYFAYKLDSTGTFSARLISRATQIILSSIQEASLLEYWPSCIAAAAILCAARDIPRFSLVNPAHAESWCEGLSKEKIIGCYQLMYELPVENRRRRPPKVLPQLRVTSRATIGSGDSSFSSSSSSCKRRKLNNSIWVDDKGSSD